MAHSDIQTTIQHYAHLRPDHTRDAVEAFAQQVAEPDTNELGDGHDEEGAVDAPFQVVR